MLEICLLTALLVASPAEDEVVEVDPWAVLTDEDVGGSPRKMMQRFLRERVQRALEKRRAAFDRVHDAPAARAYRAQRLRTLRALLSGGFDRTPPRPRRIGEVRELDGFRLERVIFESRPSFFVTANIWAPRGAGPHPGILFSCGHWEAGKANEVYQRTCALLARNGFVVLAYDPIGQGERKQILDGERKARFRATAEHLIDGVAPVVLGSDLAAYMLWDAQRALDVLASRPDVDPTKLGATGNSGGGMMTSFLMAVDDRIACAAPGCFITTTTRKNIKPGPGDTEQNLYAQSAFGLDFADFLLARAPRPTLILCATQDYVPILGTWEAFRDAKRFYGHLGFPERVDLVEADAKHGFSRPLREGTVRWMRRWLLGVDDVIVEGELEALSEDELRCTSTGNVLDLDGARSLFDLYAGELEDCDKSREAFWGANAPESAAAIVRGLVGVDVKDSISVSVAARRGSVGREAYVIERIVLRRDDGVALPALDFSPRIATPEREPVLVLLGDGKAAATAAGGEVEKLVLDGHRVLAVDLRGLGETSNTPWRYKRVADRLGPNAAEFFLAFLLGESWLGMRTEDVIACAEFLGSPSSPERAGSVSVIASGEASLAALHAAAFEPSLFSTLRLRGLIDSWRVTIDAPLTKNLMIQTVYAALRYYDISDLFRLAGPGKVIRE